MSEESKEVPPFMPQEGAEVRRKQLLVTAGAITFSLPHRSQFISPYWPHPNFVVSVFFHHVESLKRNFYTSCCRFRFCLLCQKVGARKSISVELNETNFNHVPTVFWRSWIVKRNIHLNAITQNKYLDFCCVLLFSGSRPHKSAFCNQRSLGFQVNKELGLNLSGMM